MSELPAAMRAIFEQSRPKLDARVRTLEAAASAIGAGRLDGELRARAESDAHKLAGSLGMFGLGRGSQIAGELEETLARASGADATEAARLAGLVDALRHQLDGWRTGAEHDSSDRRPEPEGRR